MRLRIRLDEISLATLCAIFAISPTVAHAHGDIEGAIAYSEGGLLSLLLVLIAVLVARLGWKWSIAAFLLALVASLLFGLIPRAYLPSWAHSGNGAFLGGLLPPIVSTTLLIFAVRVYRRPSNMSPSRRVLYALGVVSLLLVASVLSVFGYLPTMTPNLSIQSEPAQAPAADFRPFSTRSFEAVEKVLSP
jgi:hypothetical protein